MQVSHPLARRHVFARSVGRLSDAAESLVWRLSVVLVTAVAMVASLLVHSAGAILSGSLWLDEAVTLWASRLPLATFAESFASGRGIGVYNMVLYYLLLKPWTALFGHGEVALRAFSLVAFVAAAFALYAFAARVAGRIAAVATVLLFSTSPFVLTRALEARAYSLSVLLAVVQTDLLTRLLARPRRAIVAAYVVIAIASVYVNVFGLLLLFAHLVAGIHLRAGNLGRRTLSLMVALVSVGVAPITYLIVHANAGGSNPYGGLDWIPPLTPGTLMTFLALVVGTGWVGLALAFVGVTFLARTRGLDRVARVCVGYSVTAPIAALAAVSVFDPLFYPRYLAICAPWLCFAIGVLLARMVTASRAGLYASTPIIILIGTFSLGVPLQVSQEDWRGAASYIAAGGHSTAPTVTVEPPYARIAYSIYAPARRASSTSRVVWVVTRMGPASEREAPAMSQYELVSRRRFPGVRVEKWVATPDRRPQRDRDRTG